MGKQYIGKEIWITPPMTVDLTVQIVKTTQLTLDHTKKKKKKKGK